MEESLFSSFKKYILTNLFCLGNYFRMSDIPSSMHLVKKGEFFGVYILLCKGPENAGAVYIGFTVNPPRRIRQHNREIKGGAWKTKRNKGNWYGWIY